MPDQPFGTVPARCLFSHKKRTQQALRPSGHEEESTPQQAAGQQVLIRVQSSSINRNITKQARSCQATNKIDQFAGKPASAFRFISDKLLILRYNRISSIQIRAGLDYDQKVDC